MGPTSDRTVTDGSGTVTGSIAYEAFGQPVATSGSSASQYTFAATSGYRNDGDAGLTHVGARYYDAQVGRFISRDTELDQHPYLYCDHDPVNALDPSGHFDLGGATGLAGGLYKFVPVAVRVMHPVYTIGFEFSPAVTGPGLWAPIVTGGAIGLSPIGDVVIPAIGLAYGGYQLSDWWVHNTSSGGAVTDWLGGKFHDWGWF